MENISSLKEKWLKKEIDELTKKGMSKVEISNKLDVKPQYLNSILNGSKGITDSFLDKFIAVFEINQFDLFPAVKQHQNDSIISFVDKIEAQAETIGSLKKEVEILKAKLGEGKSEEHPEGLGQKTAKNVSTRPHSSQSSPDAPSANVPLNRK